MDSKASVLQLKVSLVGSAKPPVWRRLLVPASIHLGRVHAILQAAMGWEDYHLHVFTADGIDYGQPDPELEHRDERRTRLGDVLTAPGDRIRYVYDFGDHWQHDVLVEQALPLDPGARYPVCLKGAGRCPPEDCGGVWGYSDLREALADPEHENHADMLEWLGLRPPTALIRRHSTLKRSIRSSAAGSPLGEDNRGEQPALCPVSPAPL